MQAFRPAAGGPEGPRCIRSDLFTGSEDGCRQMCMSQEVKSELDGERFHMAQLSNRSAMSFA